MRKIHLIQFGSLVAVTALLLSACKKDSNLPAPKWNFATPYYKFDSAMLEYVRMPIGRHYLYKDSITGALDTATVLKCGAEKKYAPPAGYACNGCFYIPPHYFDTFTLTLLKSTPLNTVWLDNLAKNYKNYPIIIDTGTVIDSLMYLQGENNLSSFWYPFVSSNTLRYFFIPSLNIEGNIYNNVHLFISTNGLVASEPNYRETNFYWVQGVGIIKRVTRTFTTVNTLLLLRYW